MSCESLALKFELTAYFAAPSPAFSIFTSQAISPRSPRIVINTSLGHLSTIDIGFQAPSIIEAQLGPNMSNYRSPTVEDALDDDLDPSSSFRRAQTGEKNLPTTNAQIQQYTLSSKTPSPRNLEARTPRPYSCSPSQSSNRILITPNNSERRFIWLHSQSSKQAASTPELEVRTPRLYTISSSELCKQPLLHSNHPERRFSLIPHQSSELLVPFQKKNDGKKKTAWQAKFALLHRELTS